METGAGTHQSNPKRPAAKPGRFFLQENMLPMKLLFIADPLEDFKISKDSTYAMMQEAQARGWSVAACELHDMFWQAESGVVAQCKTIELIAAQPGFTAKNPWFAIKNEASLALKDFDAVLMRKDPPFDSVYLQATQLLEYARGRTFLMNDPRGLREANEKLYIFNFPDLLAPTIVTRRYDVLRAFMAEQGGQMIVKPLDGFGGSSVFQVRAEDTNTTSILEIMTQSEHRWVMAQRFLPEIAQGDKRIILINGKPVGIIKRVPPKGEIRSNMRLGGLPERCDFSARDLEICARIGPTLNERGLYLAGIDVIGDFLTEINVTSPTGLRTIHHLYNVDLAKAFWDGLA